MRFDAANVEGYLDEPSPISILEASDPEASPIVLNRSFKEALKENVDRESMERITTR